MAGKPRGEAVGQLQAQCWICPDCHDDAGHCAPGSLEKRRCGKIVFTVPAIPIAQPRQRVGVVAGRARTYLPTRHPVNAYKATCRVAAARSGLSVVLEGPIALRAVFVLPRPGAKIWKSKPMPREQHTKKPDADNLAKSLLDALNGLVWRDDSQICSLTIEKWIASGTEQPHVEVCIEAV